MESITQFFKFFEAVDPVVVVLVLLSGLFSKKYLAGWQAANAPLKTLLVATVFTVVYAALELFSGSLTKEDFSSYFLSYALATSLYELFLKRLFKWLNIQPD